MDLEFFVTDADYIVRNNKPCIRLWGRCPDGKSAIVLDSSFTPYFYIIPRAGISDDELQDLKDKIEHLQIQAVAGSIWDETDNPVASALGFSGSAEPENRGELSATGDEISPKHVEFAEKTVGLQKRKILKVFAHLPAHIPHLKSAVRDAKAQNLIESISEYDIPFYKRYLFDRRIMPAAFVIAEGREISKEENKALFGYDADFLIEAESVTPSKEAPAFGGSRALAFDLEALEENKRLKVIMASVAQDSYTKVISYQKNGIEHEIHVASEKELLSKLFEVIVSRDPDFIITYNGDAFDFALLDARAKELKEKIILSRDGTPLRFQKKGRIKAAITKGRPHLDLFNFVERIMSPAMSSETLSLDSVATELLGEGKRDLSWDQMKEYWSKKHKLDELAEYCLQDSRITLKLAHRILPNIFALSQITSQIPVDTSRMTYGQLVENYMIKKAGEMNILVPNKPSSGEISERKEMEQYAGGFVKEPRAGLHENIAVFDFRSLYPSVIVTHNIDPSTLNCDCCSDEEKNRVPGENSHFCTKTKGFIPQILEGLINERKRLKAQMKTVQKNSSGYAELDARQYAVKTVSNAMYGYLGFAGSRWYNRKCAEAVTAFSRHYIHSVIDAAEKMGLQVLYGDTDSLFLHIDGDVQKAAKEFLAKINETLPGIVSLDLQGIYKRGIFVSRKVGEGGAKKRYALIDGQGNITIRGFEKVRRDWSRLAKDTQEKVLELVLNNRKDEAVQFVKKIVADIKAEKVGIKDLRIYSQLTRQLAHYQQIGPHVAAAEKAIARGRQIRTGETLEFVITKGKGSISDRAELFEFAKNYDPEYYINNQIVPAALRVLHIFGVTEDDLLGRAKQKGLGQWGKRSDDGSAQ